MKTTVCTAALLALILFAGLFFLGSSFADTYVGGGAGGSTWTSSNNPYRLSSDVVVYSGDTLTIQAGTIVHLNGYKIQVYGTLNVQGSSNNKVYFLHDGNPNSQIYFDSLSTNCVMNYAVLYSVPVMIGGGSTIRNCYFTSGSSTTITINGGSPLITGNTINAGSQNCITINGGSPTITSNTIAGSGSSGNFGIYNSGGSITVVGNSITNCFTGIFSDGSGTIEQNTIMNNGNDAVKSGNVNHAIKNNVLAYNKVGVSGDGNIQNNAITNNRYGLWGQTSVSTITNNNIINDEENVHLTENDADVNAVNNWWGTTDEDIIAAKISDSRVYPNLGTLTFMPCLSSPASAPTVPSSIPIPTAPPTPTVTPSPSPSPLYSPTPYPAITTTPTPTPYNTYNPTPYPYQTNNPTPYYVNTPTPPVDYFGGFTLGDITNVIVIIIAVTLAVVMIVVIHKKFSRSEMPPPPDGSNSYN